jgi:hypothetical protein
LSKRKIQVTGDKDKAIQLLDTLRTTVEKLGVERDSFEKEAVELRAARREAEERAWADEEKLKQLQAETEDKLSEAQKRASDAETSRDSAVSDLQRERDELKAEMDQITEKLNKVSELYRETAAEKDKLKEKVDVSDLLSIYIVLIEKIFGGKPHARVLYTLHNTKTAITRKNLESSTGIMPTAIMKAIHDLRNADLVSYDESSLEVKLIKDIF